MNKLVDQLYGRLRPTLISGRESVAAMWIALVLPREDQASISEWAEQTFGPAGSNMSVAKRAAREMVELLEGIRDHGDDWPGIAEEIADINICLARLMSRVGGDENVERDRKMAINRARVWRLDGKGHGQHVVREDAAPDPRDLEPWTGDRPLLTKRLGS